ncbi:MAG: hypothetical protein KAH84_08520 [Thiomargarita sp.]|nr:hypothetical protein [Thiomargarita sp.]
MQTITLHSHVGANGVLQLPPNFANTNVIVTLKIEPQLSKNNEDSILVDEGGILVADVEALGDVTDLVKQDRERRIQKLIQSGQNNEENSI